MNEQNLNNTAENTPKKPKVASGLLHFPSATKFTIAGIMRLWHEEAFRQECVVYVIVNVMLMVIGAPWWSYFGLFIGAGLVMACEALNTAIEEMVDHVTPEYSQMAKHAKDLGSAAVAFSLLSVGAWLAFVFVIMYRGSI